MKKNNKQPYSQLGFVDSCIFMITFITEPGI